MQSNLPEMRWNPRWLRIALLVLCSALMADALLLAVLWPFTKSRLLETLRDQANGDVTIRGFEKTFFPKPGCIATGVVISTGAGAGQPPLITVEKLTIQSAYSSLLVFSKRLNEVDTVAMHIRVPAARGGAVKGTPPLATSIGRFVADRSVLEVASEDPGGKPFLMQIHRTVLTPAGATAEMAFETSLAIPEPPGEVTATGSIGPWKAYETHVAGHYEFRHADLGEFKGIAGILNSVGKFSGTIENIEVSGETDIPDFQVAPNHPVHLAIQFQATVLGRTGDVRLSAVKSRFLRSELDSDGSIASLAHGTSKTVSLHISVNSGRIQDLLKLVSSGPPGLNGVVSLRYTVELPPGEKPFLARLKLTGIMGVSGGRFTDPVTQKGLEHISANAVPEVNDPADAVSNMRGRVSTANGVATLSDISFDVPGASAQLNGTYQLLTHRLDLRGTVRLDEKLSQTTTGVKSFLLKALDPFFRRKKHLSVVPIRISGVAGNISIGLN